MDYKLGMPTLIEFNSIEENLNLCSSLGLDFVELNMNLPYCMPDSNNINNLRAVMNFYDIGFTMHFPEEIDFAAFYPSVRSTNLELLRQLAFFGAELGVNKINLHVNPGVYFSLPDHKAWIYEMNKDRFSENLVDSMERAVCISKEYGINICVENTFFPGFIKEAFYKLRELEGIYFTWDVGHDAKDSYKASAFYIGNADKVVHMHLHDYDGVQNHLCLYDGSINIDSKIEFARLHNLSTVVEVKTGDALEKSINRLRSRGF